MATNWFQRRQPRVGIAAPSAWRYNGPTADNTTDPRSLTAAASRVVEQKVKRGKDDVDPDDAECWTMYRQVGELRYVANAIAGRMGQAELYVEVDGERKDDGDKDPILKLLTSQMTERLGLNIFVAGGGYLAGLPLDKGKQESTDGSEINAEAGTAQGTTTVWLILSTLEVKRGRGGKVEIRGVKYKESDIYLERIWDPDPADWERADSPVKSALPVLRELVGLTESVSAQIDSRLAGAGVYWLPNSILSSAKALSGQADSGQSFSENPVLNAIMSAMLIPMEDRSNAAAVVPLMMGAPDEAIAKIRFDTFATPYDENTKDLTDLSIRRLALNLDAPPELLLGMGDSNHWAAWLVRDEVVQIHVDPRLALVTDGYTTGFYRPILKQLQEAGSDVLLDWQRSADVDDVVVKADTSGLVQRPNRLADASSLHAVSAIGDKALRAAGGFEESDAPSSNERAIALALQVATANPQLLDNIPEVVAAIKALLDGSPDTGPDALESQREPGTLRPAVPANAGQRPALRPAGPAAPNGQPTRNGKEAAPVGEADTLPRAGSPVG